MRRPLSMGPSCAPPASSACASAAVASVSATSGDLCAVLERSVVNLAVDFGLWRER